MPQTNTEAQRAFKQRMYDAGYKQIQLWVLRDPDTRKKKLNIDNFVRHVDKLTGNWSEIKKSNLFADILAIIEAKVEVYSKRK